MKLQEIPNKNKDLCINKIQMSCDEMLEDEKGRKPPMPLCCNSGFLYILSGFSGSGKTTLLMNLISRKNKNGKKLSYRGCFDTIIFVSPSSHTIKSSVLDELEHKYENFDDELLDLVEEMTDKNVEKANKKGKPCKQVLLVLDDVATHIRKSKHLETRLNVLSNNRRHRRLSIIILAQQLYQIPPPIRKNTNLIFLYKPKTKKEKDIIFDEFMEMSKKDFTDFLDFVYKDKRDFLIIDMCLRHSADIEYYRNFNKIEIHKDDNNKIDEDSIVEKEDVEKKGDEENSGAEADSKSHH